MARTTPTLVQSILGPGPRKYQWDKTTDLSPFIAMASALVDQAVAMASKRGYSIADGPDNATSPTLWGVVERNLAAHFYQRMDQGYKGRSTADASGQFQGETGMSLEATGYGQDAMLLDVSGSLSIFNKRKIASLTWLGKPPSQQIPYTQRN